MDLVERFEFWIYDRAARLSRVFGVEYDDARQELVLQLLRWNSPKLAWWKAKQKFVFDSRFECLQGDDSEFVDDRGEMSELIEFVFSQLQTHTQKQTFRLLLDGQSLADISKNLGLSSRTIRRETLHIRKIIEHEKNDQ